MFPRLRRHVPAGLTAVLLLLAGCAGFGGSGGSDDGSPVRSAIKEFDLYLQEGIPWILWTDSSRGQTRPVVVDSWLFALDDPDGPYTLPGPTIRVTEGDTVRINFHVSGHMPHTIHWHGIHLPWDMDGVPWVSQLPLGSGAMVGNPPMLADRTFSYEFTLNQSGTYFYHCHVDTAHHMDMGMYGAFIVDPKDPEQDPPYDREYILMLDEWQSSHIHQTPNLETLVGSSGDPETILGNVYNQLRDYYLNNPALHEQRTQAGLTPHRDWYPAQFPAYFASYDTYLINGKSFPDTEVLYIKQGETIRLRFINAGFEIHAMHLHGHHMLVTHKDGFLLPAPYWADTVLIGPGERYDVYVTGTNPGPWMLHDHNALAEANDHRHPGGMMTMLCYEDGWEPRPGLSNPCKAGHGQPATAGQLLDIQTDLLALKHLAEGRRVIGN